DGAPGNRRGGGRTGQAAEVVVQHGRDVQGWDSRAPGRSSGPGRDVARGPWAQVEARRRLTPATSIQLPPWQCTAALSEFIVVAVRPLTALVPSRPKLGNEYRDVRMVVPRRRMWKVGG